MKLNFDFGNWRATTLTDWIFYAVYFIILTFLGWIFYNTFR